MSRLIESNGAQVLPMVPDDRRTVSVWSAVLCLDGDQRTKHRVFRELAGELVVEK